MFKFFDFVTDFFKTIWDVIVNFLDSTLLIVNLVKEIPSDIVSLFAILPPIINVSLFLVIGVGITKLLLGWGNS